MIFYKPIVTVDTSVIVKWFKTEKDIELALELRDWTEIKNSQDE